MKKEKIIPRDPIWYPFTQMQEFQDQSPLEISSGAGCWLTDCTGKRYLDGVSSLWANVHGHCHPEIDRAVRAQLQRLAHSTMLGLTHAGGVELARRLVQLSPPGLNRVFYSESGSTAVEIALKMAYQYWQLQGETGRHLFLKLGDSYHGDTLGAVSVGGIDLFHQRFGPLLFKTIAIPVPDLYRHPFGAGDDETIARHYFAQATAVLEKHAVEACGVIVEPLIQGAAGMIVHPAGYLRHLRELCHRHNLLLIADEVAVGFGRTGKMFACDWEDVAPDLLCLGKGITGGYLPLAATLATEKIFSAYLGDFSEMKTFFHGHTYTGNPLACAAALASLEVFATERTLAPEVFGPKAACYAAGMQRLAALPQVGSARFLGMMGGVELVQDKATGAPHPFTARKGYRVCLEARKHGLLLRPLGDVVVLMPPLAVSLEELHYLFDGVEKSIRAVG